MLWKEAGPTDKACDEAHAEDSGRFDGACFARYGHVVNGFAAEVRMPPPPTMSCLKPTPILCSDAHEGPLLIASVTTVSTG